MIFGLDVVFSQYRWVIVLFQSNTFMPPFPQVRVPKLFSCQKTGDSDVGHLGDPGDVGPEEAGRGGDGRVGDHPRGDAHPVAGRGLATTLLEHKKHPLLFSEQQLTVAPTQR